MQKLTDIQYCSSLSSK